MLNSLTIKKTISWQTKITSLCCLLLASIFLSACPVQVSGPEADPTKPMASSLPLAQGLYQRGESLKSFAARGRVNYYKDKQRHFFRFEFISKTADKMLFTAFDPAGRPAFKMLIKDGQLSGVIYHDRKFVQGPATRENLNIFIPVNLPPQDLLALMTGAQVKPEAASGRIKGADSELIVKPDQEQSAYGQNQEQDAVWKISLKGSLEQNPQMAVIKKAEFGQPRRQPQISLNYEQVENMSREDLPGQPLEPFPKKVSAQWQKGENLEINYEELRLGGQFGNEAFSLSPPAGFEVIVLP